MRSPLFLTIFLLAVLSATHLDAQTRGERVQAELANNAKAEWWQVMDTGPFISDTFRIFGDKGEVAVLKGIAIRDQKT